ncbi:hypothetical protein Y1Q_0022559 [Alligator mississippiensis]|uniref:Uncharacterized protein n=1 Tax=Alligator mississippiensis TaxID=8496 RepID=A0A151NQ92_ALLMI|nr:hypothetical protein Y1Q_0022559 [Alligator mississippiensis]
MRLLLLLGHGLDSTEARDDSGTPTKLVPRAVFQATQMEEERQITWKCGEQLDIGWGLPSQEILDLDQRVTTNIQQREGPVQ